MNALSALFLPPCTLADQSSLNSDRTGAVRVMYGETFDEFDIPIDALKYYAWLTILSRTARLAGRSECEIVIADTAVTLNKGVLWGAARIAELGARRESSIAQVLAELGADQKVRIVRMSDIVAGEDYQRRRAAAAEMLSVSESFASAVRDSVRPDHLEREEQIGFTYSLDEAALVAGYDLKVGPPRETFYDTAAQELKSSLGEGLLGSVLLRPAFPFDTRPAEFIRNEELGKFGVTAYKASSMGLEEKRLILGRDDVSRLESFLQEPPPPRNRKVPDAIVELSTVLQIVRWARTNQAPYEWIAERWWNGSDDWTTVCQMVMELFSVEIDQHLGRIAS